MKRLYQKPQTEMFEMGIEDSITAGLTISDVIPDGNINVYPNDTADPADAFLKRFSVWDEQEQF